MERRGEMYTKIDKEVMDILCCPLCKGKLFLNKKKYGCKKCSSTYPKMNAGTDDCEEQVFDFRIHRPEYCLPPAAVRWEDIQSQFKSFHERESTQDNLETYLAEIDSVKEIYTEEFSIRGKVLDVGGHQGRLRHFLSEDDAASFVSVDPFLKIFQGLSMQPHLLSAYPCLQSPCNFLSCHAEYLPFVSKAFDWVHMRSVLDHFQDPYLALKEAFRVLKDDGRLLIGLSVQGGNSALAEEPVQAAIRPSQIPRLAFDFIQREGYIAFFLAVIRRLTGTGASQKVDDHTFYWHHHDLLDILGKASFAIIKEHWQKPPNSRCIYLAAAPKRDQSI